MGPVDEECAGMLPRWVDARHPLYFRHPSSTPSPYQLNTIAAAPSDFIAKSEGALELVRRWYGEGTALVGWVRPQYTLLRGATIPVVLGKIHPSLAVRVSVQFYIAALWLPLRYESNENSSRCCLLEPIDPRHCAGAEGG